MQIAGIIEIDGEVKEEFNFTCKGFKGQVCDAKALEVIGKTVDDLRTYPEVKETYQKVLAIFEKYINRYDKNDKLHMVGQNTKFDYDFMTQWFRLNGNPYFYGFVQYHLIDIIQLTAVFTVAGKMQLKNMKLATVAEHFGIPLEAHDALNDIRVTREIFYKYVDKIKLIP